MWLALTVYRSMWHPLIAERHSESGISARSSKTGGFTDEPDDAHAACGVL